MSWTTFCGSTPRFSRTRAKRGRCAAGGHCIRKRGKALQDLYQLLRAFYEPFPARLKKVAVTDAYIQLQDADEFLGVSESGDGYNWYGVVLLRVFLNLTDPDSPEPIFLSRTHLHAAQLFPGGSEPRATLCATLWTFRTRCQIQTHFGWQLPVPQKCRTPRKPEQENHQAPSQGGQCRTLPHGALPHGSEGATPARTLRNRPGLD